MRSNSHFLHFILLPLILGLSLTALAQKSEDKKRDFCDYNNYSYNKKVSFKEARELTISAGSVVNIDARRNGGISVKGENRSDVLVRACIQTLGKTETEAAAVAKNVRIETGSVIRAEGGDDEKTWSVSYEIIVPRNSNLKLTANNGGIWVSSVEGNIEFETLNGGVNIANAAGDVRGRTTNGGVNVSLSGSGWRGGGLDVQTTNGGVMLSIPDNYAARIEAGTVNGGFTSDIAGLKTTENNDNDNYYSRKKRISADLNGGGATIRVTTTNGGVKVVTKENKVN